MKPQEFLNKWIYDNTFGSSCVIEFGAMFFDKLEHVAAPKRIGIEIWESYIQCATFHDCIKVKGDFTHFEELVAKEDMDCAMFVDTLEHIEQAIAKDLMHRVMVNFNKVILMIPEGVHPQDSDVTGFEAHEYQTHRSTWYITDVMKLGFKEENITIISDFHDKNDGKDSGCILAVWSK